MNERAGNITEEFMKAIDEIVKETLEAEKEWKRISEELAGCREELQRVWNQGSIRKLREVSAKCRRLEEEKRAKESIKEIEEDGHNRLAKRFSKYSEKGLSLMWGGEGDEGR